MFALIRFEIRKIVVQKRSWVGFLAVALINALFALAFVLRNRRAGTKPVRGMEDRIVSEFMNALVYTQTILTPCAYILFPVIVAIVGSHILAGELETGRTRMMLCRPVSRWHLSVAKLIALSGYSAVLLTTLLVTSYGISAWLFKPTGDVLIVGPMFGLGHGLFVHAAKDAVSRILLSYALAFPMLAAVSAMALMFSVMTRHFSSAAILSSTVYVCSYIVTSIPMLSTIHPFMPTRYLQFWRFALKPEIPWDRIAADATWTAGFTVAFMAIAIALFHRTDL